MLTGSRTNKKIMSSKKCYFSQDILKFSCILGLTGKTYWNIAYEKFVLLENSKANLRFFPKMT